MAADSTDSSLLINSCFAVETDALPSQKQTNKQEKEPDSPSFVHRGRGIAGTSVTLVAVHCPLHSGLFLRLQ